MIDKIRDKLDRIFYKYANDDERFLELETLLIYAGVLPLTIDKDSDYPWKYKEKNVGMFRKRTLIVREPLPDLLYRLTWGVLSGKTQINISNNKNVVESMEWVDPVVESVATKMCGRSAVGLRKYNTSIHNSDVSFREWVVHIQEELMDGANYAEKLLIMIDEGKINEIK